MNDAGKIPLEALIQSEYVREYVLKSGWTFTDSQKATLLANGWLGYLPLDEQFRSLRILRDVTSDAELKSQITAYLGRMEQCLRELKDNRDRNCIYILKIENDAEGDNYYRIPPDGCFFDYESAREYGYRSSRCFQIEKLFVSDKKVYGVNDDNYDYVVTYIQFDKNGNAVYLSHEYDNAEEERFVNSFFHLPNPFERGDIVRRTGSDKSGDYGIVETSQEQCRKTFERFRDKPEFHCEFGDESIRVVFLNDDGTFSHGHIVPLYLEKYSPKRSSGDTVNSIRDNLLIAASEMYKGEGSLDELEYCAEEYRKAKKANIQ